MSNGNVTPIRQQVIPAGAPPPNVQPADMGGWSWDGSNWVWIMNPIWPAPQPPPWPPQPCPPGCTCPQCCPPVHCGPRPMPPSCFSAVAKAQACYSQSQALTALITQIINDIFTNNPGIIPTPPPTAQPGPLLGVTDGSVAAPGVVGEILRSVVTGTANTGGGSGIAAQTSFAAITLTPGDWNIQSNVSLVELAANTFFTQWDYSVKDGTTSVADVSFLGTWGTATNGGLIGGNFPTPAFAISTAAPKLLTGNINLFGTFAAGTACSFTATTTARRLR